MLRILCAAALALAAAPAVSAPARADERYAAIEARQAGPKAWKKSRQARAWRMLRAKRKARARAHRTPRQAVARPAEPAIPLPLPRPALEAPAAPYGPPSLFDAAWDRIADRVNPARVLEPAARALEAFVAGADREVRQLADRTLAGLAKMYLAATATVGGTMRRQGPDVAIGRLHPVFARRLAAAIREARGSGLPNAGCFSAYRPPALGVGGMRDKHASLHAYGLACDMAGIGRPGSTSARLWHHIASRHKLYNPYGSGRRAAWAHPWEWNHYQPTGVKIILRSDALRRTITARGPVDLERMWEAGSRLIDRQPPRIRVAGRRR